MSENKFDEKFLFFFDPVILDESKFLFGFSLKTGVIIFTIIMAIQACNSFFDIFNPNSFWNFLFSLFSFIFHSLIVFYSYLSLKKESYEDALRSYLIVSIVFLFSAFYYLLNSIHKILGFITPWNSDFLNLSILIFIFGYGLFLFFYLYFIYILYLYMIQLKDPEKFEKKKLEEKINSGIEEIKDSALSFLERSKDKLKNIDLFDLIN